MRLSTQKLAVLLAIVAGSSWLAAQVAVSQQETREGTAQSAAAADVHRYFVACMLEKNRAEVEISELAVGTSENEQVRKFAEMLVADHQKAVAKLQPLSEEFATHKSHDAITQLITIEKAIVEETNNRFREMLQEKSGAEFDECFLGFQVGCHTQMSAALDVLQSQATGQVQQLAQELKPTIDQHLKKAEELMQQAVGSREQASRSERGRTAR